MKNKINKFLDKKITIGESIGNTLVFIAFVVIITLCWYFITTDDYIYEDTNGNRGKSNICYERKQGLYCRTDIKVEWYGEE